MKKHEKKQPKTSHSQKKVSLKVRTEKIKDLETGRDDKDVKGGGACRAGSCTYSI